VLKRVLADKAFESAMRTIDNARQETQRKRIYIEAVVSPHQPDKSTEPKRLRRIFTVMIISFAAFVMIYLLVSGGRDHLNIH
jgi:capsular polysaccharide transport system permease protein